jgi:hypothetical protein
MINAENYQPARQNIKLVTRPLRSLATKLHILARQADIFVRFANIGGIIGLYIFHDAYGHVHSTICCRIQY